jgi:hypothetical protein
MTAPLLYGFEGEQWTLETIEDNVRLLTPEILDQINQIVVQAGHVLVKKKTKKRLHSRGVVIRL